MNSSFPSTPLEDQRLTRNRESFFFLYSPIFPWFLKSDLNRKTIINATINAVCYKLKALKKRRTSKYVTYLQARKDEIS